MPDERPSADELLATLQGMKLEIEGAYGGSVKVDIVRVRLAKEVKELTEQQVIFFSNMYHNCDISSITFYVGLRSNKMAARYWTIKF